MLKIKGLNRVGKEIDLVIKEDDFDGAYETTIDDEVICKEKTTQYIDIYYYANIEEVEEEDLI